MKIELYDTERKLIGAETLPADFVWSLDETGTFRNIQTLSVEITAYSLGVSYFLVWGHIGGPPVLSGLVHGQDDPLFPTNRLVFVPGSMRVGG